MKKKKRDKFEEAVVKDTLTAIEKSDNDLGDMFSKGLSLNVCVRCFANNANEDDRRTFIYAAKSSGTFCCPDSIVKKFTVAGRTDVKAKTPPEWCPFSCEHAVSRK